MQQDEVPVLHKFKMFLLCIRAQRASSIDDQAIPEVINTTQYGSTPQRLLVPRSDIEILTLFNDDISSIRDDYTVWLMADPTTFRARHMTNKGNAAPVFRKAFEKKRVFLLHLNSCLIPAGLTGYWSKRGSAF